MHRICSESIRKNQTHMQLLCNYFSGLTFECKICCLYPVNSLKAMKILLEWNIIKDRLSGKQKDITWGNRMEKKLYGKLKYACMHTLTAYCYFNGSFPLLILVIICSCSLKYCLTAIRGFWHLGTCSNCFCFYKHIHFFEII